MGLRALGRGLGVRQESISRSICYGRTRINTEGRTSRDISIATDEHGKTRNQNTSFRAGSVSDGNTQPLGAVPKGSDRVVAVGLPHRNYSVFKQTSINQLEVKVVEFRRRASEAKGPFPGGKRVGSWGKKKKVKEKK